jgi:mannose-1-phosphate guanylyltransferase
MPNTDENLYVCIMAGGKGERFWPFSRASRPKQLLAIAGARPMINETALRNLELVAADHLYVVTTQAQAPDIAAAVPELPRENVIAEPCGRDTAPCIGLMCALLAARDPNAVLAVIPADHTIPDHAVYSATVCDAAAVARRNGALVTIGIAPRFPETGYGYILAGDPLDAPGATAFSRVERFIEKPPRPKAEELIATGRAFWNAGMFVFRVADMLAEFQRLLPEFGNDLARITFAAGSADCAAVIEDVYLSAPKISIDYAVMEKAANVAVAHGAFQWDDVGSWAAVADHWERDADANAVRGTVIAVDSSNCVAGSDTEGVIGLIGVHDLVVVRTGDAVLVCPKDRAQDVKRLVQQLRDNPELSGFAE